MLRQRHTKPVLLTNEERRTLHEWARRPTTAQRLAQRSRVVLACADGLTNRTVAKRLHVSENSVCKWRERFRVRRLEGLTDEPRPGTPRTITDAAVVDVITRTLEAPPPMATQWSTRSMAEVVGLSKATISRIWQTFGLQSHRRETFKLSADPQFVDKVRDIVGLYLNPPAHERLEHPSRARTDGDVTRDHATLRCPFSERAVRCDLPLVPHRAIRATCEHFETSVRIVRNRDVRCDDTALRG